MALTYRPYLENGEDIGTFATTEPGWRVGDEFRQGMARFRITNIVVDEDVPSDECAGLFVVTPIALQ